MINTESCSLPFSVNFIRRQLTWARLYNPGWPFVVFHTGLLALAYLAALVLIPFALVFSNQQAAVFAIVAVIGYPILMVGLVLAVEKQLHLCFSRCGMSCPSLTKGGTIKSLFFLPVTIFVQFIATILSIFFRKVPWRGLMMDIRGPHDIRIVER